jgi:hypothetical protein
VSAFVAFVTGLVSLLLGWIGISGSSLPSQQIPYLASDTVFGLFALGTAATLWLSADMRDEWRKLHDIHTEMVDWNSGESGGSLDRTVRGSEAERTPVDPELNGLHVVAHRAAR